MRYERQHECSVQQLAKHIMNVILCNASGPFRTGRGGMVGLGGEG